MHDGRQLRGREKEKSLQPRESFPPGGAAQSGEGLAEGGFKNVSINVEVGERRGGNLRE